MKIMFAKAANMPAHAYGRVVVGDVEGLCKLWRVCVCVCGGGGGGGGGGGLNGKQMIDGRSQALLTCPLMTMEVYFIGRTPANPKVLLWNMEEATAGRVGEGGGEEQLKGEVRYRF